MYENYTFKPDEVLEYLRKSRSDDPTLTVEEVLSKHEAILSEWSIRNMDAAVPEEHIYREVVSGETIADRPEMIKLLKMIENPRIRGVLVVEVQRLSRGDLEDAGRIIKLFRYTNTMIITPMKIYNLHDEYDRDMFERELKRGNEFLEYQKKIMNRGRLLSVSQGNYVGSVPPYGYDRTVVMDGKRKCPTLKINEEQASVVRMIFDLYVNHDMGRQKICNHLDELHIKPPKGTHWSPETVVDMLSNVHYTGKVKWNWRKTVTVIENQEAVKTRPKSKDGDFLIYDGKHEAIISDELFEAAQAKKGRNHRAKPTTKVRNPLAGLVYCSCGRAMSLRYYKRPDGTERSAPRLMCDGQFRCNTGSCRYSEILIRVNDILECSIADFEVQLKNDDALSTDLHKKMISQLEVKLEDLKNKEINQWEKYSEEGMPKEIFDKLNEKVLKEQADVSAALAQARASMPSPVDYQERINCFTDALEALNDDSIDAEKKNILLKNCIDRITYSRERPVRMVGAGHHGTWTDTPINLEVKLRL
ncbi:MAG: recombinase family protein [Lachnospiraceae bacterium]|nr:recombinase family protein [Lachnospiraceae bacterium]MBO5144379.1 recombinase family protein [Lachnospiraceae bacterium]